LALLNYLKEPFPESLEAPVPVTALPVDEEESFVAAAPGKLLSEEFILPVSLAEPVPVTALPVADEELTDEESVIAESDESELLQDAKQKVAAMKIKIVRCFMIKGINLFLILYKNLPGKRLGQEVVKSAIHHDLFKIHLSGNAICHVQMHLELRKIFVGIVNYLCLVA
jgi:hypothetical protein